MPNYDPEVTSNAKQLSDRNTNGTILGQDTSDLIGFYGKTAVVQPSGAEQAAVSTTAATTTTPWGFTTSTQANAIVSLVNQIRADLVSLGLLKGSA